MKIKYQRFKEIVTEAEAQPDQAVFLAEYGIPEWILNEVTDSEVQAAVDLITAIHTVVHMTSAELVRTSGMTQTKFAERFMIPLRTVQNWCGGQRTMPRYEKFMFAVILGFFGDLKIV